MTINDLVQKVSVEYRKHLKEINLLKQSLYETELKICRVENGEDISLKEYNELLSRRNMLQKEIPILEAHTDGMSEVREMLMDLGFETEIK